MSLHFIFKKYFIYSIDCVTKIDTTRFQSNQLIFDKDS